MLSTKSCLFRCSTAAITASSCSTKAQATIESETYDVLFLLPEPNQSSYVVGEGAMRLDVVYAY